ncbi:hypothetical protein SUGI_1038410 [Cryptomeria japonica]|nr:hypothetical protein SUGI_1038410 [Cryptomeria japonica]
MLIKGIRSFSPENTLVITFFRPLTLIVGPNGAGKTTIIECLKHACTGEMPPNARSGHSFIHDPKVAGETETKAQIKLRFKTAAGKDVVCIRSFQLTQKASKMEYKAIESVLQTINPHTGEKVCLSYRCADMDREVPALMGVSKAILENVIFVHQDDANWPLAEASILKKKFDDIFSATRYTKALEVIKKLHKEQAQEIKMYKLKLENLQTLKDAAYKLRQSIEQDQDKVTSVKNQIQELEKNIQNIQTKIDQTEVTLKDLRKLQDEVRMKDTKRSTLFKLQQTQYAALAEENEDTDEELREWQVKFEERIAHLKSKISKLERELNDTSTESDVLTKTINDTFREMGKLQAQADAHLSVKHDRDKYIQTMFVKHNLGVVDNIPLNNELAFNLTNRAKQRLKELLKDSAAKKESNDMEIKSIWKAFESVSKQCSEFEGQKLAKQQKKEEITYRLKEIDQELENPRKSDTDLARIDEKERLLEEEVQRKTSQLDERDFESDIQEKINERYRLEKNIKALQREKDGMASESEDRIKLGLKKDELESFKRKITKIIDDNKERIKATLKGRLPSVKDLKKEINSALSVHKMEYDDLLAKSVEAEKELQLVEMKIKEAGNNQVKYQRDREGRRRFLETKLQSLVQSSMEIDGFPGVLEDAIEKRNIRKSQHDIADGMRRMFDPFERVARANHVCPCCERSFTPEEEDDFVRKQRTKSSSSAERVRELAMHSSNADAHFQQLDKLRSVYDEYVKLGKELIPSCDKLLDELSEDRERKLQAHDDLLGLLAHAKSEKDSVERLLQPVETTDRFWLEMQNVQKQVEDLEYKLDVRSQGLRSMEEVNSELASLEDKRESLQRQLEKVRDDQKHMTDDLLALKLRWHGAREEKLHACNELTRIKHLREEQEKLEDQKVQTELDEQVLVEGFIPVSKEKEKLRKDYDTMKLKFECENEERSKLLGIFQQDVDMLFSYSSKIKEYLDSRSEERLKELQEKLSLCESQQRQCEKRKSDISAELNRSQELLRSQDQVKRNIDDNIAYRKTKADVDSLAQEMEALDDKIVSIGEPSAVEADLKRYLQEKEKLLSELNRYQGTIGVYQSNISKNKLDLKQAQYKDIDKRYCDQLIELKTTEMANKDLDKYYNALDKALMRFHSMKMEEINKIIKELWQQTYRGQDIDYISIRSDAEGAGTRSYSYRVVMQSGDAELEMRGRCSAGQKVLASLIIRLALAETFCLNCGILALDEPTTNLDAPNAESLATALLRIMEDRKNQENFQLIVITHDERFAQLIGQRQHAERYYRISKDEHQHSIIEAQEIFD